MAVPSSLTDNYDALLTATLRAYADTRLHDNIHRSNKLLGWLDSKGHWKKQDGGERVQVPLMYGKNDTADIYSGYGTLNTTPQDGITSAFFDWSQISVSIAISRKEERQNSGRARMLNLLEAKTTQAEASLHELLNNCITQGRITASAAQGQFYARIGVLDSGATGPLPIPALIDSNASRSVAVGNINGSTYSWWRNRVHPSVGTQATTWAGVRRQMNTVYNLCSQGSGGSPDLILCDRTGWETYWNGLEGKEQYVISDPRIVDILGGSNALKFRGAAMIWDEVVPDTYTNATVVDAIGTVTLSSYYFLNTETLYFISDSATDFITTPFVRPENQDAKVAQMLWMGALGMNNRQKNGILDNVLQTITA